MIQSRGSYPVYQAEDEKLKAQTVIMTLDYEQIMEIANIFYHVNKWLARIPRILGGVRLTQPIRALHASIHESCIRCCISLEEARRLEEKEGLPHA